MLQKQMESSQFAPLSGLILGKMSILARFYNTSLSSGFLSRFASPIPPRNAESPHVRNTVKTNEIFTLCSFERLGFGEIINISQVLQYFLDARFSLQIRLADPPSNAKSPHARNSIQTNEILTFCSIFRLGLGEIINISQVLQDFCDLR